MPSLLFVQLGGFLHGINRETGQTTWETELGVGRGQLVCVKDRVYVAAESKKLFILNANTGKLEATTSFRGMGQAPTILADGDRIFVTSGGTLNAFDLDGEVLWSNPFKGRGNGSMGLATATADRQADEY
jgi:outer membrane protein assembly factor BamB